MTIADKLTQIAANTPLIYDKGIEDGKDEEYNAFWDSFQQNGTRENYRYTFGEGWTDATFKPKYKLNRLNYMQGAFRNSSITKITRDASDAMTLKAAASMFQECFYLCSQLTEIEPTLDARAATGGYVFYQAFYNCTNLKKVTLRTNAAVTNEYYLRGAFQNCSSLEELYFTDSDSVSCALDVRYSPLLTARSLESILSALNKNVSGKTLTLNAASRDVINNDAGASYIYAVALQAGWTIAFA